MIRASHPRHDPWWARLTRPSPLQVADIEDEEAPGPDSLSCGGQPTPDGRFVGKIAKNVAYRHNGVGGEAGGRPAA